MKHLKYKKGTLILAVTFLLTCASLVYYFVEMNNSSYGQTQTAEKPKHQKTEPTTTSTSEAPSNKDLWNQPTGGDYPTVTETEKSQLKVEVSLADQKVYIKKDDKTIYTMICSTGDDAQEDSKTPSGTFNIEEERGESFYEDGTGTCYNWVSFSGHGVYLFHSIPMESSEKVNETEAAKFGTPSSHGCIRLSLPDSKWFYNTIATGTAVTIS